MLYRSLRKHFSCAFNVKIKLVYFLSSALDAESERLVQEALDRVSKGKIWIKK